MSKKDKVSLQILQWNTAYVHVYFNAGFGWDFDGVVDMDVVYEANESSSKHPSSVYLSYFILDS